MIWLLEETRFHCFRLPATDLYAWRWNVPFHRLIGLALPGRMSSGESIRAAFLSSRFSSCLDIPSVIVKHVGPIRSPLMTKSSVWLLRRLPAPSHNQLQLQIRI